MATLDLRDCWPELLGMRPRLPRYLPPYNANLVSSSFRQKSPPRRSLSTRPERPSPNSSLYDAHIENPAAFEQIPAGFHKKPAENTTFYTRPAHRNQPSSMRSKAR